MTAPALVRSVAIDGWSIVLGGDDEPLVRDIDLGERLGFARPRKVRELVERMLRDGILNPSDVRPTVGRTRIGIAERLVTEYLLTETAALLVIARSDTAKAVAITRQVVQVFLAVRRGASAAPTTPVLATGVRVADNVMARDDVASRCRLAAAGSGLSLRRVHGAVRKQFLVAGVYQVPLAILPLVREFLEALALRRLVLPAKPPRLPPRRGDDRQLTMRWN